MPTRWCRSLVVFLLAALVGCSILPVSLDEGQPPGSQAANRTQVPNATPIPGALTANPAQTGEAPGSTPPVVGQFVRIWLSPEFDPDTNGPANRLLKARLEEFAAGHPNTRLEVRVKAVDGPGGLLDSLVAANAAAPSDLPDLVLLPRWILESAALKGLLFPYDDLTNIMKAPSWFEYALQMARLKDSTYGVPFAGDIMVLARSLSLQKTAPLTLELALSQGNALLYPAADPQALFTLCLYIAEGGRLQDEQGRPVLEQAPLGRVLNYYEQASLAGLMPFTLTQLSEDAQVWEAFLGGPHPMAVTWASRFLKQANRADLEIAPLPTPDGTPFTLATGWSWALAGQDAARRSLAVQLVESLVDSGFLAQWTQAAGYLPPRVDALQGWQAARLQPTIEQVSYSAWLVPPADIISSVGPALQTAVLDVLSARKDAQAAAQAATSQVSQP